MALLCVRFVPGCLLSGFGDASASLPALTGMPCRITWKFGYRGNHTVGKWERVTRNSPPLVLISQGVGRSIATGMMEVAKHPWLDCVLKVGL